MRFYAAVMCSFQPKVGHRLSLFLADETDTLHFVIPNGVGAYNYLITTKPLIDADWGTALEAAYSALNSPQPVATLELDANDIDHLAHFRLNSADVIRQPNPSPGLRFMPRVGAFMSSAELNE